MAEIRNLAEDEAAAHVREVAVLWFQAMPHTYVAGASSHAVYAVGLGLTFLRTTPRHILVSRRLSS
jgi:hypothetical protein